MDSLNFSTLNNIFCGETRRDILIQSINRGKKERSQDLRLQLLNVEYILGEEGYCCMVNAYNVNKMKQLEGKSLTLQTYLCC